MSLYGNYIAEQSEKTSEVKTPAEKTEEKVTTEATQIDAADAFYEAAMKVSTTTLDFNYYGSIVESSLEEITAFEQSFFNEFAFISESEAGAKRNIFKEAIDKLLGWLNQIIEKLKGFISFIGEKLKEIKNKHFSKKNGENVNIIKSLISKVKENAEISKAKGYLKQIEFYKYTPEFMEAVKAAKGPKELKLNFGYSNNGSFAKNKTGQGLENIGMMSKFHFLSQENYKDKCYTVLKAEKGDVLAFTKYVDESLNMIEGNIKEINDIKGYFGECKNMCVKVKELEAKQTNKSIAQSQGEEESDDYGKQAGSNAVNMRQDFDLLQRYCRALSKMTVIITHVSAHNLKEIPKYSGALEIYKAKLEKASKAA